MLRYRSVKKKSINVFISNAFLLTCHENYITNALSLISFRLVHPPHNLYTFPYCFPPASLLCVRHELPQPGGAVHHLHQHPVSASCPVQLCWTCAEVYRQLGEWCASHAGQDLHHLLAHGHQVPLHL